MPTHAKRRGGALIAALAKPHHKHRLSIDFLIGFMGQRSVYDFTTGMQAALRGGTTTIVDAAPTASPYTVAPIEFGSYLLFRIVFRTEPADLASIKLYAYADHEDGRPIIQQATYAYPPTPQPSHGFTGQQRVYEPRRGGELDYWCEMRKAAAK